MEQEFMCPNCNKPLVYDENLATYFCPDCGENFAKSDFEVEEDNQYTGNYKLLECKMCSRSTLIGKNFNYEVCPFCYSNLVSVTDTIKKFNPNFIIYFKDDIETFKSIMVEKIKEDNVPSELYNNIQPDSVKGVYIPLHIYTIEDKAEAFLRTSDKNEKYADDFYSIGVSYIENIDVTIDITDTLDNRQISELANYDVKGINMFFPDKTSDFFILMPRLDKERIMNKIKEAVKKFTETEMTKYISKNDVIKDVKAFNTMKHLSRKTVLVPIWIIDVQKDDETHTLYVNGQTYRTVSDVEYPRIVKKTFFGKIKQENYQIKVLERDDERRRVYTTSLEFMNEIRKRTENPNDRSADIRKIR